MALHKLKDVLFNLGDHEGFDATPSVLRRIVDNFKALKENFSVPLKLGHDNKLVSDGMPSIGWVDNVYLDDETNPTEVIAEYRDLPTIVFKAIKNKLYAARSIELETQLRDGKLFENVLVGVALLGATLPRVEKISDLDKYMSHSAAKYGTDKFIIHSDRDASVTRQSAVCFSSKINQGIIMTPEQIKELQDKAVADALVIATMTKDNAALTVERDVFKKGESDRLVVEAAGKVKSARDHVTKILNDAVIGEVITPAKRDTFSKLLNVESDEAVVKITDADLTGLLGDVEKFSKKSTASSDEVGARDKETDEAKQVEADLKSPMEALERKTFAHMEKNGKTSFSESLEFIMQSNKDLAESYKFGNGTVGSKGI